MSETITVRGFLGGEVEEFTTLQGLPISNFRLGCTPRRFDRKTEQWVNGETNWYTVSAFRQLAQNVKSSLHKGDPVLVTGRLRVRQWENEKGQRGTSVEIDAEAIGYDLTFGSGSFTRLGGAGSGEDSGRNMTESNSESSNGSSSSAAETAWGTETAEAREPAEEKEAAPF
ncbi:single-stranded DNA-binding protein [Nesterenkonia sp. AN1]|uniref:Single-stranded DNA-binding protein n=1 Tax=Nesterenkonia aurantiaca TaxID=1436010 RepID=A0A4R7G0C2_9MICC|nr:MULTISPECIES: single-stranded DNA-binding protein [Nesterenkonia]EXF25093.1 single-stranded DNA-binding protein [Nesterenkonia sp. AN1]TDS84611.1 single-strand DNA-binding protein [Nesterenkonia aurantiaca]